MDKLGWLFMDIESFTDNSIMFTSMGNQQPYLNSFVGYALYDSKIYEMNRIRIENEFKNRIIKTAFGNINMADFNVFDEISEN